ncbi:MAG: low molecular weight phosphotyrosine protein phosphatase [Actinobacteria bacterium]|nr:low molecular weight phosphotyrosine protein phosphatase [Actinomycetota bacterium]
MKHPDSPASPPPPRHPGEPYRICVVCLGNICRSPIGERVLTAELAAAGLAGKVVVDSAGTGDWHLGEPMDVRAQDELARRGHDGNGHQARQIRPDWLDRYDLLLAIDRSNLSRLTAMAGARPGLTGRIALLRAFDPDAPCGAEVPDPYYGGPDEFADVFDLIDAAAKGLVGQLSDLL